MRGQSVSSARARAGVAGGERGLQHVGARAPPSASARASAARPRRMSSWSQRARSCSRQQDGLAVRPAARRRGATPGFPSGPPGRAPPGLALGHQPGEDAAEAQRLLAQVRPHPVVAGGGRIAFIEDQVDRPRAPTAGAPPVRRPAAPRRARRPPRACAWRARCAARSSARSPGRHARSRRSSGRRAAAASAPTRASVDSTGWQAVNIRPSRSSPTSSSRAASRSGTPSPARLRARGPSSTCLRSSILSRRSASMARRLAVAISQAPGLSGTPSWATFQRGDQRVLRQLLGEPDVSHHARQPRDQAGGLDPPDGVDGGVDVGGRHGCRSRHRRRRNATSVKALRRPPRSSDRRQVDLQHLAYFALALPSRPMLPVEVHEAHGPLHEFVP